MPKHSNKRTKQKNNLKRTKLLKARLIRISMVIDDYLYKNKAISPHDASAYVEEVSKYKAIFERDVRSLQVIEKITRCMNAIIIEQQDETGDTNINFYNTSENYCPSPVYSLPEEDKAVSQASININLIIENTGIITDEYDTIDLCDEDVNIHKDIQVDVEIHREMSTLSIKEHEPSQDPNITDYSQTLLRDFNANREDEIRKMTQEKIPKPNFVPPNEKTSVDIDCSQSILKDIDPNVTLLPVGTRHVFEREKPAHDKAAKKLNVISQKDTNSKNNRTIEKKLEIKNVRFNNNIETIDITEDDTTPKKRLKQTRITPTKVVNKVDKVERKISGVKQTKGCRKNKTTKITMKSQEPIEITTSSTNKSKQVNYIQTKLPFNKNTMTTLNEAVYQKIPSNICNLTKKNNTNYSKSMAKIYNTTIENDLSWVENIRFVREIATDEFDPKYASLADIFWENFDLPTDWNENDFDYNC